MNAANSRATAVTATLRCLPRAVKLAKDVVQAKLGAPGDLTDARVNPPGARLDDAADLGRIAIRPGRLDQQRSGPAGLPQRVIGPRPLPTGGPELCSPGTRPSQAMKCWGQAKRAKMKRFR